MKKPHREFSILIERLALYLVYNKGGRNKVIKHIKLAFRAMNVLNTPNMEDDDRWIAARFLSDLADRYGV